MRIYPALLPLMLLSFSAAAEIRTSKLENEFGYVLTRGSSHSETIAARSKGAIEYGNWSHEGKLEALNVMDHIAGERSIERYHVFEKTRYEFDGPFYMLLSPSWEKLLNSGKEYVLTGSAGVGYHAIETDEHQLRFEAGPGYRHEEMIAVPDVNEAIAVASVLYRWQVSSTATFEEDARVESGDSGTVSRSAAQLKVAINSRFSLKLRHDVRHDSRPEEGKPATDTLVSVTVSYDIK